jgi:hypothetical protein
MLFRGKLFTEPLPSNEKRYNLPSLCLATIRGIHIYAHRLMRGAEMGSNAMIYIQRFRKIGSVVQKLVRVIHRHTDSMEIT